MARTYTNLNGVELRPRMADVLRWKLGLHDERQARRPRRRACVPAVDNDGSALRAGTRDTLTWIGHASFLLQAGGCSILVDPVLSRSLSGVVRRHGAPGLDWAALPRIDAVLITHNHRDHMDEPTLKRLGPAPLFLVPMGMASWFRRAGLTRVVEMAWWQTEAVGPVSVTFVPAEHWSRRGARDTNLSWWGGFVVEHEGRRIYHAGDTAWFSGFADIGQRVGRIDVAMLPIGSYAPRWFMHPQHMNPEDAVQAFLALGARQFVPMHWGTFQLADDPIDEAPHLLRQTWDTAGLDASRLVIPAIGETIGN
jgi:L-ascorbate metabolism protein UlaG (beta-lactamase superfamily)